MDIAVVTRILNAFLTVLSAGYGRTLPEALWLLQRLATIELVLLGIWWALGQQEALANLLSKMLWFGALLWFLTAWPTLSLAFVNSLIQAGLVMGGSRIALHEFLNPSVILEHGMRVIQVILARIASYTGLWSAAANLPETMLLGIAALGIWCAFFILAAQVFVKILEFYMMSLVVVILLPFGMFRHTSFLAEKAFAVVIGSGISLAVLAVITSLALPVMATLQMSNPPTLNDAFTILAASGLIALLAWQGPALAAGLMSGAPALSAATLAQGTLAAGAAALLGGGATYMASRGIISATQQATTGVAALGTAARQGGLGGVGRLAQRVGSDLTQATIGNFRAATQRGHDYAQNAIGPTQLSLFRTTGGHRPSGGGGGGSGHHVNTPVWAMRLAQASLPPGAHPQGGMHVPLNKP